LLHIAPRAGEIFYNRNQIRRALAIAAGYQANIAVTPELAESGYLFTNQIDLNGVPACPNVFISSLRQVALKYEMNLIIGFPERDLIENVLYNSAAYIDAYGSIQGIYRKVHVNSYEGAWETAGDGAVIKKIEGIPAGILIGEDICYTDIAYECRKMGAKLLLALTAWPRVEWNVSKEWEKCSKSAGLPLVVCNRTGSEGRIDFTLGESVVATPNKIIYTFTTRAPMVFVIDFNPATHAFSFVGSMRL
jgi:predicted amidohydrolase